MLPTGTPAAAGAAGAEVNVVSAAVGAAEVETVTAGAATCPTGDADVEVLAEAAEAVTLWSMGGLAVGTPGPAEGGTAAAACDARRAPMGHCVGSTEAKLLRDMPWGV